jgi:peroxiredoxin
LAGALLLAISLSFQAGTALAGAPAPGFRLKDLAGHTLRLSDYRGKVLVINFWATWCAPCLAEMPELVKLQQEYKAKGIQVIGVAAATDRRSKALTIKRRLKLNYLVVIGTKRLESAYGIGDVLPLTVVVDRNGIIRERILGILEPEEVEGIRKLLD